MSACRSGGKRGSVRGKALPILTICNSSVAGRKNTQVMLQLQRLYILINGELQRTLIESLIYAQL